jgi:hypothetical protein
MINRTPTKSTDQELSMINEPKRHVPPKGSLKDFGPDPQRSMEEFDPYPPITFLLDSDKPLKAYFHRISIV